MDHIIVIRYCLKAKGSCFKERWYICSLPCLLGVKVKGKGFICRSQCLPKKKSHGTFWRLGGELLGVLLFFWKSFLLCWEEKEENVLLQNTV